MKSEDMTPCQKFHWREELRGRYAASIPYGGYDVSKRGWQDPVLSDPTVPDKCFGADCEIIKASEAMVEKRRKLIEYWNADPDKDPRIHPEILVRK